MAARFSLPFIVLVLALGGCVLPNRLAEEDPFRQGVTGFIEPGITSKTEIERQLGTQYLGSSNDQWWVFPADRRMTEWFWMICTPGGCGGAEFGGDVYRYNFIVEFDSDDLVRRTVVVTDQSPCIDDQSICFDDGELTVVKDENVLLIALEYDLVKTPCAFLRRDKGYESNGFLGELLVSPDVKCKPALTMRDGLTYVPEATRPFTGQLTISGIEGFARVERSYVDGILNGTETAWSESGEKLYQANYRDNLLHGQVTYWKPDGTTILVFCFENGDVNYQNPIECH